MNVLIDWLSFTLPWRGPALDMGDFAHRHASGVILGFLGKPAYTALFPEGYERIKGRFPFPFALHNTETNAYLMYHEKLPYVLCELSGRACFALSERGLIGDVVSRCALAVTRLDLSCDIESDIRPIEFAERRSPGRIRTVGYFLSDTGESCYVGSSQSDRRAVVYKFNPPHPRSGRLRVEHRCRAERAVQVAQVIAQDGATRAIAWLGEAFGWEHPLWQPELAAATHIPAIPGKPADANRKRWLDEQVIPALRKLEQDGVIPDLRAYLYEHLFHDHGG